ncbi:MAG TPA: ABC transporter permease [Candidatus Acidoferrales bacterium]
MRLWRRLRSEWGAVFGRARLESELDAELRFHVEAHAEDLMRAGLSREEAVRQARVKLGGVERTKEECRDTLGVSLVESLIQDVRFGLRMLRKNPGFTAVAVITLALGIGANTAIFGVVDAVLLRPLPYKNADRIVWAAERFPFNHDSAVVLSPDFIGWKEGNDVFKEIGAFGGAPGANLTGGAEPQRVTVTNVTTNFFPMLGIQPVIGRRFLPEEAKEAASHVALLNETLWRSRFGADRHIAGKEINLDGTAYTVVGVIPGNVNYPHADIWTPLALDSKVFSPQSPQWMALTVIGLLKSGVTVDQARTDLQVLTQRMDQQYPPQAERFRANARADVVPLHAVLVKDVRLLLLILLGSVGLVLMIACANVANLLLSRAAARGREIAVRAALGAGRWRLVRQMLTESLLLSLSGGLVGLAAGFSGMRLLRQLIPPEFSLPPTLEWKTFGFAAALAILATAFFGLVPALAASICDVNESLKARPVVKRRRFSRLRSLPVLAEISLSLVLLTGAGLLVRSFVRLTDVNLGFEPSHLLLATVQRPFTLGFDSQRHSAFFREALERIRAVPGVQDAAVTGQFPLGGLNNAANQMRLADGTFYRPATPILLDGISPGYFRTMGIRLLKGRVFDNRDSADAPRVAILSESFARQAFKGRDSLGQRVDYVEPGHPDPAELTVVGVVSDARNSALDQEPLPELFTPDVQHPFFIMTFAVRSKGDPRGLAGGVRQAILSVDKDQPVSELQTMDDLLASSVAPQRFRMLLVGLFALLALALAAVGVYGVMAYSVRQRTHEIGVRIALGAQRRDVMKLLLGEGAFLAVVGAGSGIAGAFCLTRFFSSLLFSVKPTDPVTFLSVSMVLVSVVLLASYIPARRATRVDPMVALRHE